jgi:hypothetical protein
VNDQCRALCESERSSAAEITRSRTGSSLTAALPFPFFIILQGALEQGKCRFGSLPGAGSKITPRLLGEIGSGRSRFEDPEDCGPGAIILSHDPCYNRLTLGHSGFPFD